MDDVTTKRIRAALPFWTSRTPGWEAAEDRAALYLYGQHARALSEARYADARAIQSEMRG